MRRIQDMSRGGWIVIGVVIALLLVPSGMAAARTAYDGIIGTSGNKADVTAGGQLLTTEASPGQNWSFVFQPPTNATTQEELPTAPSGDLDVINQIQIDTFSDSSPGPGAFVYIDNSLHDQSIDSSTLADVNPPGLGNIVIPISPPQAGFETTFPYSTINATVSHLGVTIIVTGYFAPCSEVPGAPC